MWWMALWAACTSALAAPRFDDIACAEVQEGPPKGARALMEGVLPEVHLLRRKLHAGESIQRPDEAFLQRWMPTELPRDALGARAARVATEAGDTLVLELQAPERPALVEANVTAIVDTSSAMDTSQSPRLPGIADGPPSKIRRPVTRMMLAKAALHDLVRQLPQGSQLTLVAASGARGRMVLPPSTDAAAMHREIDLLREGMLGPHDAVLTDLLEDTGRTSFKRCADNRAFVFTYRTDAVSVGKTVQAIKSFGAADAQIWTLGVGTYEPMDLDAWITEQPSNRAKWVLNSREDARRMWRTLFSAGGVSARDVELRVTDADGATLLTEAQPTMVSGAHQVVTLQVPPEASIDVTLRAGETEPVPIQVDLQQPPWARARLAARDFAAGQTQAQLDPPRGVPSELAAWTVIEGAAPAPQPPGVLSAVWSDPSPGGPYLVADIAALDEDLDPERVRLELGDGSVVAPVAWYEVPRQVRYVFRAESQTASLRYDTHQGDVVAVDPPGIRSANDVLILHGRAEGADEELVPDGVAAAELYEPDFILTQLVARLQYDLQNLDEAARWAGKCIEAPIAPIAIDCRLITGLVLEDRKKDPEAEAVYLKGVELYPEAHRLWYQAGEVAFRAARLEQAEQRYLEAMATGASSFPTCVRLADVMDQRGLKGLAALALARVLLVEPEHDVLRDRLFAYFDEGWEKAPKKYGKLGRVTRPRGKTSPYWLTKLIYKWGQAYRREISLDPEHTFRWAAIVPRPFYILHFEKTKLSGAYRIGYTPGTIPEDRVFNVDDLDKVFARWRPPVR